MQNKTYIIRTSVSVILGKEQAGKTSHSKESKDISSKKRKLNNSNECLGQRSNALHLILGFV